MANPISLPQLDIRPQVISSGGAPDPLGQLLPFMLQGVQLGMEGKRQKSNESAQVRDHEIRMALLKLEQQKAAHEQAKTEALGGAMQQGLKNMAPVIEAQAPYMPPGQAQGAMQMMGGPGAQQAPQGPPAAQMEPQQMFSQLVQSLPPDVVPDFVKSFAPIAQAAQAKLDVPRQLEAAFRESEHLLTPDQRDGLKTAIHLAQAGVPKEVYEAMLPKAQMELAKGWQEVKAQKNKEASDRVATGELIRLGLVAKGPNDIVVDGATKMLADYIADVRKDARKAAMDRAAQNAAKAVEGIEGTALELASTYGMSAPEIKKALKQTYGGGVPDGVLAKAALEAPGKASKLNAPANENQAKARLELPILQSSVAVINAMDAKGESMGIAARLAQTESTKAAIGGAGAGFAVGNIPGALIGAAIGGAGAPAIRGLSRKAMSTDQQRLFTAAEALQNAVNRMESGATVNQGEKTNVYQRYVPLNTDDIQTKELKRTMRNELLGTWAQIAGMPKELQQPILDRILSKHEQMLPDKSAPNNSDLVPRIRGLFK